MKSAFRVFVRCLWLVVFALSTLGFVATTTGCGGWLVTATELKEANPHLAMVQMCKRTPDVPDGVGVWVLDVLSGRIETDRNPDKLRVAAKDADYVFWLDPHAPEPDLAALPDKYQGWHCHIPWVSRDDIADRRARREAHFMGESFGGGASGDGASGGGSSDGFMDPKHPSAPAGYTVDGLPGKMPWHFHMGYAAHKVIAAHYVVLHQGNVVFKNHFPITTIVDKAGGNKGLVRWNEADLRPDIADITDPPRCVFEIKPHGDRNLAEGKKKADQYIGALNVAMVGETPFTYGLNYNRPLGVGVRFKDGVSPWNLTWTTTAPGVVQYKWRKLDNKEESDKGYREAYEQGRWRDLTEQEMQDHARELHEAVELLVRGRDMVGSFRAVMTAPIDAIGTVAEFALSAALWNQMSGTPKLLPVLRKPPPSLKAPRSSPLNVFEGRIRPATPPSPPVNARSLGSDTHTTQPGRATPRPTTPGKTTSPH